MVTNPVSGAMEAVAERHLTSEEQAALHEALRKSVRVVAKGRRRAIAAALTQMGKNDA